MSPKWLIPIIIFFGVYALSNQGLKGGPEVSAKEAAGLMAGAPRPVVIDVRERTDYDQGHIASAISVPSAEFNGRLESLKLPKFDPVIIYSADDARARDVTKQLYESGYQGVLTLKGGIDAWRAAGQAIQIHKAAPPAAKP